MPVAIGVLLAAAISLTAIRALDVHECRPHGLGDAGLRRRRRSHDGIRVGALGDANWVEDSGDWIYGKFEIREIAYNVTR